MPETRTPCFKDQEESARPGPEQVLQGQTQIEQKEGRQEEHSRLDGWGSLTRRHEAATAVRGQETPKGCRHRQTRTLSGRHRQCRGLLSPEGATVSHGCTWSWLLIADTHVASAKGPEGERGLCHSLKSPTKRYHQLSWDQGLVYIETRSVDFSQLA